MNTQADSQPRSIEDDIHARYALGHGQGLLFAYGLVPGERPRELTLAAAEEALTSGRSLIWLHLDITTTPAKRWIEAQPWLPDEARDTLLCREERSRLQTLDQGLTGILRDFHRELEEVDWRVGQLHFYIDRHRVITGRRHPLAGLDRAQQALMRGCDADSGPSLLALMIEALLDLLDNAGDKLGEEIERVEDHLERDEAQPLRTGLGEARKRAILFHRQIRGERRVLVRLIAKPPSWFSDSDTLRLREVVDRLAATAEDLDTVEVRAKLLQDEIGARLAEATNRNLYVLSILSAIVLPMTLVAGLLGMNFSDIPAGTAPFGFWIGTGFITLLGFITFVILRITKIL